MSRDWVPAYVRLSCDICGSVMYSGPENVPEANRTGTIRIATSDAVREAIAGKSIVASEDAFCVDEPCDDCIRSIVRLARSFMKERVGGIVVERSSGAASITTNLPKEETS